MNHSCQICLKEEKTTNINSKEGQLATKPKEWWQIIPAVQHHYEAIIQAKQVSNKQMLRSHQVKFKRQHIEQYLKNKTSKLQASLLYVTFYFMSTSSNDLSSTKPKKTSNQAMYYQGHLALCPCPTLCHHQSSFFLQKPNESPLSSQHERDLSWIIETRRAIIHKIRFPSYQPYIIVSHISCTCTCHLHFI